MTNPHSPHPADDDLDTLSDLPPDVVANVGHLPPPKDDPHHIHQAVVKAHLEGVLSDLGEAIRRVRAALASMEN